MQPDEPASDAELRAFTAVSDHHHELERLLGIAVLAIPTCIGVSLLIRGTASTATFSALRRGWHNRPVQASMSVHLPRPMPALASDSAAELVVYAAAPHAFRDAAPDVLALLDMTSRQVTVDAHLEVPDLAQERATLAHWLDDQTVMDRAVGMLLDRGLLPEDGRRELARLAEVGGFGQLEAARRLIASARVHRDEP